MNQARLKELLSYDPDTGEFRWLQSRYRNKVGTTAGCLYSEGYRVIALDRKRYLAHRLAWLFMTGVWPGGEIDHINGNPSDNRFANLREATRQQNGANRRVGSNNKSGFKGVHWHKGDKRWRAQIMVAKRIIHLGSFETPEAAHAAYLIAASEHFGEFRRVA
jgi:hypothetical protein